MYNNGGEDLWSAKIQEIRDFQCGTNNEKIPVHLADRLVCVYEKYKAVFSDEPGKVKNYQCKLEFKENVEFNRRSYPIAHSLKEAVRTEINKMIEIDIIEISQSPYTSPIIAVPKKDGQVRLCLDARELNKTIVNDRTLPGEIEEILKRFHGTKSVSYTHLTG